MRRRRNTSTCQCDGRSYAPHVGQHPSQPPAGRGLTRGGRRRLYKVPQMDVTSGAAVPEAAQGLMLRLRYEFAEAPDDLPPAPFLEPERVAPGAPSAVALETALRQWRLAVEFAVALSDEETMRSYAKAVDERSRRTAADQTLRRTQARRIEPPRYRGLRVLRMRLDSPWELTLGLGPAFTAAGPTRLLFQLVERAFGLPLDVDVRDAELRKRLEALRPAAVPSRTDRIAHAVSLELAATSGVRESNDPFEAAVDEIRDQLPYEDTPTYTGEVEFSSVEAVLTDAGAG